ncbi:hypothetical protein PGK01_17385 [Acinetobacter baumannii]|nr:hypothetical protein [Acinetobacter baumannii]
MKKLSMTLLTITTVFLNQHTYSETYEIDMDMYYEGVINKNYEVSDLKKFEEVLWRMNQKGIQRYPFKKGAVSFCLGSGIGRDVPELFFSNFFKKTLSGNMKVYFLNENKKVYKTISENVKNCNH